MNSSIGANCQHVAAAAEGTFLACFGNGNATTVVSAVAIHSRIVAALMVFQDGQLHVSISRERGDQRAWSGLP